MKRVVFCFALLAGCSMVAESARADSWIFAPSYYSHTPPQQPVPSRRPYPGPFYTRPQGAAVTVGFRFQRSYINIRGQIDQYNVYESFIQTNQQF